MEQPALDIRAISTTGEASGAEHAGEATATQEATSRIAGKFHNHPTLCIGILYLITIIVVIAFVARL
jgi:hypothetical protein